MEVKRPSQFALEKDFCICAFPLSSSFFFMAHKIVILIVDVTLQDMFCSFFTFQRYVDNRRIGTKSSSDAKVHKI